MSLSTNINAVVKPTIFREYIGAKDIVPKSIDDFPGEMINSNITEFHFLLGFAREHKVGTGEFKRTWNFNYFSPTKVLNLKKDHKNAKVIISIGGDGFAYQFDPTDKDDWIKNATSSIKELILDYENEVSTDGNIIDGIDIDYEYIRSNEEDFSYCIGQVIQQLKEDSDVSKSMNIVSIAPTETLQSHYLKLYLDNKENIDWIDYKFYNQSFISKEDFIDVFDQLVSDYGTAYKLLVGLSSQESSPTTRTTDLLVNGCTVLIDRAYLAGCFVWDANASAFTYTLEGELQELLTKK